MPLQAQLETWAGEQPGAIVAAVVDADRVAFVAAGKWAEDDEARRPGPNTFFEIGSISKVFTALLAAQAVEQGRFEWDDPVAGGFASSSVTYAQLATHTSGLPRLPADFPDTGLRDPYFFLTLDDLQRSFTTEVAMLSTGPTDWAYSNFGAAILGQATAAAWNQSYADAMREQVLAPLGMEQTWISGNQDVDTSNLAPGHNSAGRASRWRFDAYAPAGAWVSTTAEMTRLIRAVLDPAGAGLGPALRDTLAVHAETGGPDHMGYGWFVREVDGEPVYWHDGGTGGYRSFLGVQPARGRGIVILAARDQEVDGIGLGWLQGLFEASDPVATGKVSVADYVGDYPIMPQFVLAISATDGTLQVQGTGQPKIGLRATGVDSFTLDGVPAVIDFERGEDGTVTGLVLHQGGRDLPAPRHAAGSLKAPAKGVQLPVESLKPLVGKYQLAPSVVVQVFRDDQQVYVQLTGQPALPVYASAKDEFYYEVVDAQLSFERDDDGVVTGLVLHQNGQNVPAPKVE